jgi:NitT/TauT family transport system permease protein
VALNMRTGLAAVDPELVLLMRSVGASRSQVLFRAQLPTSIPYLFAGLRIAVTFSVIGAVVAEFSAANKGLGYVISYESTQLDTPKVFAALLVISLLGLVFYYLLSAVERAVGVVFPRQEARVTAP